MKFLVCEAHCVQRELRVLQRECSLHEYHHSQNTYYESTHELQLPHPARLIIDLSRAAEGYDGRVDRPIISANNQASQTLCTPANDNVGRRLSKGNWYAGDGYHIPWNQCLSPNDNVRSRVQGIGLARDHGSCKPGSHRYLSRYRRIHHSRTTNDHETGGGRKRNGCV